jgi:hypothetical protein
MATLSALEKRSFEDLFEMSSGYVMGDMFTNASFADLFQTVVQIKILDQKYEGRGTSKANRLREFWTKESDPVVGRLLRELMQFWLRAPGHAPADQNFQACQVAVARLLGEKAPPAVRPAPTVKDFLSEDLSAITAKKLPIDPALIPVLERRLQEATACLKNGAPLATIFLCGSILEGALLCLAIEQPQRFNQAKSAPKDGAGKVKKLEGWTLADFINVAYELKLLKVDVKSFSETLRDFRNYIHPMQEMASGFNPDQHTATICMQVLKAAIAELSGER